MERRFSARGAGGPRLAVVRLMGMLVAVWLTSQAMTTGSFARLLAQEERNPSVGPELSVDEADAPSTSTRSSGAKDRTFADSLKAGGWIGGIIILMSVVAVAFAIEHSLSIRKQRLMPEGVLLELEDLIARGDLQGAVQVCQQPENYSLATDVVLAGLERYQSSEFGFADYKSAVEEAGEDHTARLYRKTDGLNVISVVAPMLGLFGTVQGMIQAFNVIASQEGAAQPHQLADSISMALVTTWLGLVVAIPSMVAFSYFRNKIDSLVSECGKRVERILTPLSRRR